MKKFAVQYFDGYKLKIDTDIITKEEAKKIYNENLDDIIDRIKKELDIEFVVWCEMNNNTDYHKELLRLDRDTLLEDGKIPYIELREYIEFN